MTWIKICGTTNLEDALLAVEAGAEALGFVFHAKSPRNVAAGTVRKIVAQLPDRIEKVGVFVDQDAAEIAGIVKQAGLTAVQLHRGYLQSGEIFGELYQRGLRRMFVTQPARVVLREEVQPEWNTSITAYAEHHDALVALLIDSGTAQQAGGTGEPFDWARAAPIIRNLQRLSRVVVAGGLNPENVAEVMRILKPWGVDVVSGVEATPGKKDVEKVRAFVRAVRAADQSSGA